MFRLIPHRALIEPKARVARVDETAEGAEATLRIDGLLCSACAANVRRRLERVDGVRSAEVDLERGEAEVSYDPARTSPEALVAAVEGAVILRPVRRLLAALAHFPMGRASARRQAEACPSNTRSRSGSSDPDERAGV
jgi:copper chaperone